MIASQVDLDTADHLESLDVRMAEIAQRLDTADDDDGSRPMPPSEYARLQAEYLRLQDQYDDLECEILTREAH